MEDCVYNPPYSLPIGEFSNNILSNDEMINLVARGEVMRLAKEDSHVAQKAAKAAKSANKMKLDAWKAVKDQAWAAAKLDNEAALAWWELEQVIAHESGTTVPLKPILVSQVELWKMADGKDEGQVDSSDSESLEPQSEDEGGEDEQDEWSAHSVVRCFSAIKHHCSQIMLSAL